MHGYLVVVEDSTMAPYKGVDRVPAYPAEYENEEAAAEEYALGDFKSPDSNLVDSLERAFHLFQMFSESKRTFEVLYCSTDVSVDNKSNAASLKTYGYDVAAVTADYWSIVRDFPKSDWAGPFRQHLNANGLFDNSGLARQFLEQYRANCEPDADAPFEVVLVRSVELVVAR